MARQEGWPCRCRQRQALNYRRTLNLYKLKFASESSVTDAGTIIEKVDVEVVGETPILLSSDSTTKSQLSWDGLPYEFLVGSIVLPIKNIFSWVDQSENNDGITVSVSC